MKKITFSFRKIFISSLIGINLLLASQGTFAAQSKSKKHKKVSIKATTKLTSHTNSSSPQLLHALQMVQVGQYEQAVPLLYALSRKQEFADEKMQIKYILGTALEELGLNQIAAFQFVEVIKNGNSHYVKQAIEKLSIAADRLGDDTLLNYAISKVHVEDFPASEQDIIMFRLGEVKLKNGQYQAAIDLFSRVTEKSRYYFLSKYNKGLAYLESNRSIEAIKIFKSLVAYRSPAGVTDTNKIVAQLGLARAYYQATDWDNAVVAYREIPKDHVLWHDALFESSWALLRAAKFRSALSNFQSLHSTYYEDSYIPESLLLRAIVYLYICKYEEMAKVLDLFVKTYGPLSVRLNDFIKKNIDPMSYYSEIEAAYNLKFNLSGSTRIRLPVKIDYNILREGDVKRAFGYLKALNAEKIKLDSLTAISLSHMGAVGRKILSNRYRNARIAIGEMTKLHMISMRSDLHDLYEQSDFIRYEMMNGEKEQLKKRIAGKDEPRGMANETVDRSVYVQNGYEYWPFDGEYWLDEIGNYHYLGNQSCE
jgi:tetratricopeptide (TPR) repeat protein